MQGSLNKSNEVLLFDMRPQIKQSYVQKREYWDVFYCRNIVAFALNEQPEKPAKLGLLKQSRRQGSHSINRSGTARCARK
jgi:hypothetical protein